MTVRTATGATLTVLEALEPAAKVAWEDDLVNVVEAVQLSSAITARRNADAAEIYAASSDDLSAIEINKLDQAAYDELPTTTRNRYEEKFQ